MSKERKRGEIYNRRRKRRAENGYTESDRYGEKMEG